MFFKKKVTGKQWILSSVLLFFFILILLAAITLTGDKARFDALSQKLFQQELSDNMLNLHYTLAYPENYDVKPTAVLPIYTGASSKTSQKEELLFLLSELEDITPDKLSTRDAYAYDLLQRYLVRHLKGADFAYYSEPFSPNSGIQSSLPILLADYTFRRQEDIENYLDILEQSQDYLNGLLQYETEKAAAGLFMADYSAQKIIDQCSVIMDKEALARGEHFLHTTFKERLDTLVADNTLTPEQAACYLSENDRLLTCILQPAYEQITDTFTILMGKGTNRQGLSGFKEGRAYYEYLLAVTTGSDRDISEIKEILLEDFAQNYQALLSLLAAHPELMNLTDTASLDLPLTSADEMLINLTDRMQKDFPSFPADESNKPFQAQLTLKKVSSSMEDYCSPAYYLTPPIDDMTNNIIYINGKNSTDHLGLYTTLAHEGYPGHLYQTVYSQLIFNQNNDSLIRSLLHYGGFVEGWAYYVEDLSYTYAKEISTDVSGSAYYELCRLNRNIHIGMYALLDIAIHYDGASLSQVQKMLQNIGITNSASVSSIYQYIVEEPVNYLKYYWGFLEMQLLKEEAKVLWGEEFTPYRFHQFVLETGPSDFTGLHQALKNT